MTDDRKWWAVFDKVESLEKRVAQPNRWQVQTEKGTSIVMGHTMDILPDGSLMIARSVGVSRNFGEALIPVRAFAKGEWKTVMLIAAAEEQESKSESPSPAGEVVSLGEHRKKGPEKVS